MLSCCYGSGAQQVTLRTERCWSLKCCVGAVQSGLVMCRLLLKPGCWKESCYGQEEGLDELGQLSPADCEVPGGGWEGHTHLPTAGGVWWLQGIY